MEKFKSIPELIQSLNLLASRINNGTVGLEEFEVTLRDARELYERLVILRYKAIEDRNLMGMGGTRPSASKVEEPQAPPPQPLAPKQISLIDSIEEISREQQDEPELPQPPPPPPPPAQPEPRAAAPKPVPPPTPEPAPAPVQKPVSRSRSEVIPPSEGRPESLADKLSHTKIADLTVAIGLNQKFRFIKELFGGDADAYNQALKKLNTCNDISSARQWVEQELKTTYEWDEEDQLTLTFLSLIERRYLS
ncbi:MAG: hypothetical protein EA392_06350 [Cryomorphaceae bacterium]|nr:MAG: hypothetical protein EA392_06350 [Cryomorphaceae bacterium]